MKITIVSEKLSKGCGLETYYNNLIRNLKRHVRLRFLHPKKAFGWPLFIPRPKTKIVHFTDQRSAAALFFTMFRRRSVVVTVHDIIEIANLYNVCRLNTSWKRFIHMVWSYMIKKSLRKADALIAVSEHTKKDIKKYIGYKKKIYVVYEASQNTQLKKVKRDKKSVLYIGSNLNHKNLNVLLDAFALLTKKIPKASLVLAGGSLPKDKRLISKIRKLDIEENIIFRGFVSDLSREYAKAGVFVMPSLYEGFGLPVVEAMAQGCPVLCSNKASLPEVGGNAAMYFDGYNNKDLALKIEKVLKNSKLRKDMAKRGIAQSKRFSWEKCARETIEVYRKVM